MTEYDERTLEQVFRDGLAARAEEAPEALGSPWAPGRAHTQRRRTAWLAAAAAVVVAVAGAAVVRDRLGAEPDRLPPGGGPIVVDAIEVPADWRVESYGGVQVRVPPEWGWGGAPFTSDYSGRSETMGCGVTAMLMPGSRAYERAPEGAPYVGRPVFMTDMCDGSAPAERMDPSRASVWLGAPLTPGRIDFGDGWVRETVDVGGVMVTVTSDDEDLRATVLASATRIAVDANECPTAAPPEVAAGPADLAGIRGMSVCAYSELERGAAPVLLWSDRVGAPRAASYVDATRAARQGLDCDVSHGWELVMLGIDTASGTRWDAVKVSCGRVVLAGEGGSAVSLPLTRGLVEPWASEWVKAYLAGPVEGGDDDLAELFRGMMG